MLASVQHKLSYTFTPWAWFIQMWTESQLNLYEHQINTPPLSYGAGLFKAVLFQGNCYAICENRIKPRTEMALHERLPSYDMEMGDDKQTIR